MSVSTQARLEQVAHALQATRRELVAARKRHARATAAEAGESPWRRRVALTIYVLSGHRTPAAAAFLAGRRAQRKPREREAADRIWRERVEDWFLSASVDDIVNLGAPSKPLQRRVLHRARVFHAEYALAQLVVERNEGGIAPSTAALRKEAIAIWGAQEKRIETSGEMPRAWAQRQSFAVWASRWRRRWGGRVGALPPREHVPLEVRQRKARRVGYWRGRGGGARREIASERWHKTIHVARLLAALLKHVPVSFSGPVELVFEALFGLIF
jgi:hypothetical protein